MVEDPGKAEFNADLCGDRSSIENTIGIVKKRFTIMKHGFTYPDLTKCSKAIQCCCALHNFILKYDKLDYIEIEAADLDNDGNDPPPGFGE